MATDLRSLQASNIALIKLSAVGDIVHALPVLGAIRRRFPTARLTWVVNRAYAPLLEGHPYLDGLLLFDRGRAGKSWFNGLQCFRATLREIRRARFDLVIDLQGLLRSGIMTWWSGAERRIGLFSAREGARFAYTDLLEAPAGKGLADLHAVDRYWLAAEALGVGDLPRQFVVPIKLEDRAWAEEQLRGRPRPWLAVNLGTRWETKRWPVRHFAELVRRSIHSAGGTAILVGAPAEAQLACQFRELFDQGVLDLTGKTTLGQLAAVIERAEVVLSNDSGPLHLAAALGRPVVAPFTCTSPVRTGPYGQAEGVAATRLWCAASYLKRCSRMDCMTELTPDRLWPLLERHLRQWQSRTA
jgi:lipopolysaccharide heptosyltransferase I